MRTLIFILIAVAVYFGASYGYEKFIARDGFTDGEEITWEKAVELINECRTGKVWQTHARVVTLVLSGNVKVKTIEPKLDDLMDIAASAQDKCGKIIIGTE